MVEAILIQYILLCSVLSLSTRSGRRSFIFSTGNSSPITPVEAKISWIISKNQSTNHFPGSEIIFDQLKNKSKKIRRGIICDGNFIVRKDTDILNINGENIGIVTSGCFSPILNRSIAMAFIDRKYTNEQQKVYFKIRGKIREAKMTNLPFVPHKYVYAKEKAS